MDKKQLRGAIRSRSAALTQDYRTSASAEICRAVLESEQWAQAQRIFTYISMPEEPDTKALAEAAWAQGKQVFAPLCLTGHTMAAVEIQSWDDLRPGKLGIPEPMELSPQADPETLELILVPCVSAWQDGARLGHGVGYYDRYLEQCSAPKLCLCFSELLSREIPMDEHDILMDLLATENGLLACRSDAEG